MINIFRLFILIIEMILTFFTALTVTSTIAAAVTSATRR